MFLERFSLRPIRGVVTDPSEQLEMIRVLTGISLTGYLISLYNVLCVQFGSELGKTGSGQGVNDEKILDLRAGQII